MITYLITVTCVSASLALCPIKAPLHIPFKSTGALACIEKANDIIRVYQRDPKDFKVECRRVK